MDVEKMKKLKAGKDYIILEKDSKHVKVKFINGVPELLKMVVTPKNNIWKFWPYICKKLRITL